MNQPGPIPGTPKEILRAIRILFVAIIAGATIFTFIVLFLNRVQQPESPVKKDDNIFLIACIAIAAVCLVVAWTGYNKGIALAKNSLISLTDKLNQYRSALVRYLALCDGPAILGIILFFVNGDYLTLIVTAVMIAAMIAKMPTRKRVTDDLGLDWKQQQELE